MCVHGFPAYGPAWATYPHRVEPDDLIQFPGLELRPSGLLTQAPQHVYARSVSRPLPARAALPVRVAPDRRERVDVVAFERVRTCGRIRARDLLRERQLRRCRLEERHRDLRKEGAVRLDEADDQLVALRDHAVDVLNVAVVNLPRADDLVRDERRGR